MCTILFIKIIICVRIMDETEKYQLNTNAVLRAQCKIIIQLN